MVSMKQEFSQADFGDERLNRRFIEVAEHLLAHPSASIRQASGSWAEAMAAYRLFENEHLSPEEILGAHQARTILRLSEYRRVLDIEDTTTLSFGSHLAVEELGSIAQGKQGCRGRGLWVHSSIIVTDEGLPLGVLDQQIWSRAQLDTSQELFFTESKKWIRGLRLQRIAKELAPKTQIISVCDREADFNDYLAEAIDNGLDFVVRAESRRCDALLGNIRAVLADGDEYLLGHIDVEIPARSARSGTRNSKKSKAQSKRLAHLSVRAGCFDVGKGAGRKLQVYAILLREESPEDGVNEPLCWQLFTSLPVTTFAQAVDVVGIYKRRWQVEDFHRVLKSGCRVESCMLQTVEKIKKFVTVISVIAWRLHRMAHLGRVHPNHPCTDALMYEEWHLLMLKFAKKSNSKQPPTIQQATIWIAMLAGYFNRKNDPPPGPLLMWRGWQKLMEMVEGYKLALSERDLYKW